MKPLQYSHVYIIESLRPADSKTGTELFNDVVRLRMLQKGLEHQCELIAANTKLEFFAALESIKNIEITQLANPVIHFELHGDDHGLEINNGEPVSWDELQFYLLQLNGICRNNLLVTMATCKGGYIFKMIDPSKWAPFWGFVGPYEEVLEGEILANYSSFYNEFLASDNLNLAIAALHAANSAGVSRFRFNNTEFIFQKAYKNYEVTYLTNEIVKERVNQIFKQCRARAEFNSWPDDAIKAFGPHLILDEDGFLKKKLMRKFFMLDKFPEDAQYYEGLE